MNDSISEAFQNGCRAAERGDTLNPYPLSTEECYAWVDGFQITMDELKCLDSTGMAPNER